MMMSIIITAKGQRGIASNIPTQIINKGSPNSNYIEDLKGKKKLGGIHKPEKYGNQTSIPKHQYNKFGFTTGVGR